MGKTEHTACCAERALRGLAAAPGVARGPARVLRSVADAASVGSGDVLVVRCAEPGWVRWFGRTAAVVSDVGGMLCTGARAARAYGIPAVFGVGDATARLRDGEWIEVDGTRGTVRPLSR